MQNPEVECFKKQQSTLRTEELDLNSPMSKLNNMPFNHLVSVFLPNSSHTPQSMIDFFSNDCEYYKIIGLNSADLLNIEFLDSFVKKGHLCLLSVGTRLDCDDCVCITPSGILNLSLRTDSYQTLGLEGKVSHFTQKNKDRYTLSIDLKNPNLKPGKAYYERNKNALKSLDTMDVIISWITQESSICPSSIAKYFNDLEYSVFECTPEFMSHTMNSVKTPFFTDINVNRSNIIDIMEWLGTVSINRDLSDDCESYVSNYKVPEPNIHLDHISFYQWKGFYQPSQITNFINFIRGYENSNDFWRAIYIQGFSDAPETEQNKENHFFTDGDNVHLWIFNKSKCFRCIQKSSSKRYK